MRTLLALLVAALPLAPAAVALPIVEAWAKRAGAGTYERDVSPEAGWND